MPKTTKNKKRDIPFGKIALGTVILIGGYQGLKAIGLIEERHKTKQCNKNQLSTFNLPDYGEYTFDPDAFAAELNNCYSGLTLEANKCNSFLVIIDQYLSDNDLRCLHNSWIKKISKGESIYNFLNGQVPYPYTDEEALLDKALTRLAAAGLKETAIG
mgnify:CR=1 FL=1